MAMEKFKAPPLPTPPDTYDRRYMLQFMRTLELYFSQWDSKTPEVAESYRAKQFIGSAARLVTPLVQVSADDTQVPIAADTPQNVELPYAPSVGVDIGIAPDGTITPLYPGIYWVSFRVQFENTSLGTEAATLYVGDYTYTVQVESGESGRVEDGVYLALAPDASMALSWEATSEDLHITSVRLQMRLESAQ